MTKGLLPILISSLLLLLSINANAAKFVAVSNNNWDIATTWDLNAVPTASDTVYIDGYSVNINDNFEVKAIFITNLSNLNYTSLNIIDTLTITGDLNVASLNKPKDIEVILASKGLLTVHGNVNFSRSIDNVQFNRLQFQINNDARANILGDFTYDYKNSGVNETAYEVYLTNNGILDVTGKASFIASNGKDLNLFIRDSSQVILRNDLDLLLYGGQEVAMTSEGNSHFQVLGNAYILNSGGVKAAKINSSDIGMGGKVTISGNVLMESTADKKETRLNANGINSELIIGGNITMTSTSDSSNLIYIGNTGTLKFGGNLVRPTLYGALRMEPNGKLIFNGSEPQSIPDSKIANSGMDSLAFGVISIENTSSSPFELTSDFVIKDSLVLTSGKIKSSEASLIIVEDGALIKGGSSDAYIEGPVLKKGAKIGESFTFPVGDKNDYAPLTITPKATLESAEYTVAYNSDPPPFGVIYNNASSDPPPFGLEYLNYISGSEFWQVDRKTGTPDADITLAWHDAEAQGINDLSGLVVAAYAASATDWVSLGNGGTTGTTGVGGSGTVSMASDPPPFGVIYFTLGSTTALNVLPVELTSFQAVQQNAHVYLEWETASERNTSHFSIERSTNGIDYKEIGTRQGSGDRVISQKYNLKDVTPENGINYYRLKIVDHDGTFEYSNIEVVVYNEAPAIQLFPNPVEKTIQLEGFDLNNDEVLLEIFDKTGKLIFSEEVATTNGQLQLSTDRANIKNTGTYFLRIINQGKSHIIKFIKTN